MHRHRRMRFLAALVCLGLSALPMPAQTKATRPLWVGSTDGVVRVYDLGAAGKLVQRHRIQGPKGLGFLAFHPRLRLAYGVVGNSLQVYRVAAGRPQVASRHPMRVRGTHVAVDPQGRFVLVASYGGDAVLAFPLDAAGEPGPVRLDLRAPAELCRNAHQVRVGPRGAFAYAPCLGDDTIQILALEPSGPRWSGRVRLRSGSGPRHMDIHRDGGFAYVLNERASTIYAYRRDPESGALTEIQAISALPDDHPDGSRSSDIHLARGGGLLYAVHREPLDQIVTLSIGDDGRLRIVGRTPTGGSHSRCFALSEDGGFAVLAHSKTEDVVVRRIDPKTGVVGAKTDREAVGAAAVYVGFAPAWAGSR